MCTCSHSSYLSPSLLYSVHPPLHLEQPVIINVSHSKSQCFCGSERRAYTPGCSLTPVCTCLPQPTGSHLETGKSPMPLASLHLGSLILLSHLLSKGLHHTGTCSQEMLAVVARDFKLHVRVQTQVCTT